VRTKLANKPDEQKQALPAPTFLAEQDDTALVTAAESGSNEAFEVLVRRHQARPLRVAWRFTRNLRDAEDITSSHSRSLKSQKHVQSGFDDQVQGGSGMIWARMLAYITGTADQELLLRNEYLAAENRILRAQIKGFSSLSHHSATKKHR
jgi:hypothetical protein